MNLLWFEAREGGPFRLSTVPPKGKAVEDTCELLCKCWAISFCDHNLVFGSIVCLFIVTKLHKHPKSCQAITVNGSLYIYIFGKQLSNIWTLNWCRLIRIQVSYDYNGRQNYFYQVLTQLHYQKIKLKTFG